MVEIKAGSVKTLEICWNRRCTGIIQRKQRGSPKKINGKDIDNLGEIKRKYRGHILTLLTGGGQTDIHTERQKEKYDISPKFPFLVTK